MPKATMIRRAMSGDAPELLAMIEALTRFHDDVPLVSPASLVRDIFATPAWFYTLVADTSGVDTAIAHTKGTDTLVSGPIVSGPTAGLAGYAALLPVARLGYGARGLDLHHLYIVPSARGTGLGAALVRASEALARDLGCSYLNIGTHAQNHAAHGFYQHLGYEDLPNTALRFTRKLD